MYVHCIQAKSRWFNGTIVSAPSYLGQKFAAQGPEQDPEQSFSKAHYEQHVSGIGVIKVDEEVFTSK